VKIFDFPLARFRFRPYFLRMSDTATPAKSQTEMDALALAVANGIVYAGTNHPPKSLVLEDRARMSKVHHATITALVRKGELIQCHSSDGGYAGKLA
jgi:hypothetical protein